MKLKESTYSKNRLTIKIEGFDQGKAVNKIIAKGISFTDIRYVDMGIMTGKIYEEDLQNVKKTLGLNYRVSVERTWGITHALKTMAKHKIALAGALLFVLLVALQSFFVMEIEIKGNETIDEPQLRAFLRENGLKEGSFIYRDYGDLEKKVADEYDRVVWVRIRHDGRYVLVDMAEGLENYSKNLETHVDGKKPCDIVADKSGYIYDVQPYIGHVVKDIGSYVKKGEVIISGTVPMESYAYGTPAEHQKEFYAHAHGDILAKIPRNIVYVTERNQIKKIPTGERSRGLKLTFLGKILDFSQGKTQFKKAIATEKNIIDISFPFDFKLSLKTNQEVKVKTQERDEKELKKEALQYIDKWKREKLEENSQISNKSLNFQPKENIIKVSIVLETIEKIGKEKEIVLGDTKASKSDNR